MACSIAMKKRAASFGGSPGSLTCTRPQNAHLLFQRGQLLLLFNTFTALPLQGLHVPRLCLKNQLANLQQSVLTTRPLGRTCLPTCSNRCLLQGLLAEPACQPAAIGDYCKASWQCLKWRSATGMTCKYRRLKLSLLQHSRNASKLS